MSTTDSDAAIVNLGKSKLTYQVHRAVDEQTEIITATEATPGDINEAHRMMSLVEQHEATTGVTVETVVADSKYGTIDNFLACHDRGIQAHMPDLRGAALKRTKKRSIFTDDMFLYDPQSDTYRCPAGNLLKRKTLHAQRESLDYGAPKKICAVCELREQCTKNKSGRTVKRHLRQDELNTMRERSRSAKAKRDIKTRQHLMERSFAQGTWYGFDQARWRGLGKMHIQEYLTCAIQNIKILIKHVARPKPAMAAKVKVAQEAMKRCVSTLIEAMNNSLRGSNLSFGPFFQRT